MPADGAIEGGAVEGDEPPVDGAEGAVEGEAADATEGASNNAPFGFRNVSFVR